MGGGVDKEKLRQTVQRLKASNVEISKEIVC